jgi:hypothetical protein
MKFVLISIVIDKQAYWRQLHIHYKLIEERNSVSSWDKKTSPVRWWYMYDIARDHMFKLIEWDKANREYVYHNHSNNIVVAVIYIYGVNG